MCPIRILLDATANCSSFSTSTQVEVQRLPSFPSIQVRRFPVQFCTKLTVQY